MLEIDGVSVLNMPHNNVVEVLKDYGIGDSAIIVVQRNPAAAARQSSNGMHFSPPPPPSFHGYLPPSQQVPYLQKQPAIPLHPYGGMQAQSYMHLPNVQVSSSTFSFRQLLTHRN